MSVPYVDSERFLRVPFLSLSPTSTTLYHRTLDKVTNSFTKTRIKLEDGTEIEAKPPTFKEHSGDLSEKAKRNLTRSVNIMLCGVDERLLLESKGTEKITFVTLTLPSPQVKAYHHDWVEHWADDKQIKKECLNQLLTELRELKGVNTYVWKAEKQINGNLHFHLLIDKKICWEWLRERWNTLINKFGFVDRYQQRMQSMTKEQYTEMRMTEYNKRNGKPTDKQVQQIQKAFTEGVKCNWTNPNSTDIETLRNIKNVAGYISKYMSKDKGHETKKVTDFQAKLIAQYDLSPHAISDMYSIKGRIWQCSQNISKSRKCITFAESEFGAELSEMLEKEESVKVFEDETIDENGEKKEARFVTFIHSFKQLNIYCKNIYETFINHIQKHFYGLCNDNSCFNSFNSSNSLLSVESPPSQVAISFVLPF